MSNDNHSQGLDKWNKLDLNFELLQNYPTSLWPLGMVNLSVSLSRLTPLIMRT